MCGHTDQCVPSVIDTIEQNVPNREFYIMILHLLVKPNLTKPYPNLRSYSAVSSLKRPYLHSLKEGYICHIFHRNKVVGVSLGPKLVKIRQLLWLAGAIFL